MSRIIYAEKVGHLIQVTSTYQDKDLIRSIPGSRYNEPSWTLPLSWAACQQLRGTFHNRLDIGPNLKEWATQQLTDRINPANMLREDASGGSILVDPPAGKKLYPFQESDVRWMLAAQSGITMGPTGSGKTITTLTWMRQLEIEQAVIVCPAQMRLVWAEEAAIWYPEVRAIPIIGTASERRKKIQDVMDYGGIAIMGFEAMRLHSRLASYGQVRLAPKEKIKKDLNNIKWEAVIVDEAHRMKDPKSKQTRAIWAVADGADYRWALTATPTTKGIDTLWPILHFIDKVEWPTYSKFVDRYAETTTSFWGGMTVGSLKPEKEAEFRAIFNPRSRRLPKEVVLPQLPPIVRRQRVVELEKDQREAYTQMARQCLAQVDEEDVVVATSTAAQYTRLGQLASSYIELQTLGDKTTVELCLPSSKIKAFLDDYQDWQQQEDAVAVFATSRRLIELLSKVLKGKKIEHSKVVGGQSDILRKEQIDDFQSGKVNLILVVIAAGGTGITLTRARIGAFLQRSWSRVEDLQSEGRIQRIGSEQHSSLLRVDYIAKDTVDVGQLDVLQAKNDILQDVLQDKDLIKKMVLGGHID